MGLVIVGLILFWAKLLQLNNPFSSSEFEFSKFISHALDLKALSYDIGPPIITFLTSLFAVVYDKIIV